MSKIRRALLIASPVVLLATALGFEEVDRIGRQLPGAEGQVMSVTEMIGPLGIRFVSLWSAWDGTGLPTPAGVIVAHVAIDLVFIATYVFLTITAIGQWFPRPAPRETSPDIETARARRSRAGVISALGVLVAVEVIEIGLLLAAASALAHASTTGAAFPTALAFALGVAEAVKGGAAIVLIAMFLFNGEFRRDAAGAIARVARAVYAQRLALVLVAMFVALALLPPWHALLEQLPEAIRAWFDRANADLVPFTPSVLHFLSAIVAVLVFAGAMFVIGRKRAELYWEIYVARIDPGGTPRRYDRPDSKTHMRYSWPGRMRYAIWASPIVLLLAAWAVVALLGQDVEASTLVIFCAVLAALLVVSLLFERSFRRSGRNVGRAHKPTQHGVRLAGDVMRAGDVLAGLTVGAALLAIARSLTSPLIVDAATGAAVNAVLLILVLLTVAAAGAAVAVSALPRRPVAPVVPVAAENTAAGVTAGMNGGMTKVVRRVSSEISSELDPTTSQKVATPAGIAVAWAALAISVVFLGLVVFAPQLMGSLFGVVAVTVGALGSLATLIGLGALFLRLRRPLAVFEWVGLRADPVIILLIVLPLAVTQLVGAPQLHDVDRVAGATATAPRDSLEEAFSGWLTGMEGCGDSGQIPLVVVAAEGGGIRAAAWTDAVLAQFATAGTCASNAVFLSSGVSGGSVGLAVAATVNPRPDQDGGTGGTGGTALGDGDAYAEALQERISALSGATTLPAGVAGLIVSDPLASMTGLRLATTETGTASRWRDRAALIEDSWRSADGSLLGSIWDTTPTPPTGYVVLNSTDILSGCRVSISQVDLGSSDTGSTITGATEQPRCDQGTAGPALTLDLVEIYESQACPFAADWATAAMLSARFPVVTPGGVIDFTDVCPAVSADGAATAQPRLHLVDGGYAENSGVGLIADIAPRLGDIIRRYNDDPERAGKPLVVPYLVYIQNSPGADLFAPRRDEVAEFSVPLIGFGTADFQNAPSTWIQRAMTGFGSVCDARPTPDSPCDQDVTAVPGNNTRVVLAAVTTEPSAVVPLGWALAQSTVNNLFADAKIQAEADCSKPDWSEYSCLGRLLDRIPEDPQEP